MDLRLTSVILDLAAEDGRAGLLRLAGTADIALESFSPAEAERHGLTPDVFRQVNPRLVVVSVTGFGRSGPYRDFAATEPVLAALGGVLSRSGRPGARPVPELPTDPHLAARESFRTMAHPLLSRPVPANARAARFSTIGDPPLRPAPIPGQHTRQVAGTLLGLAPADIGHLVDKGVLQEGSLP